MRNPRWQSRPARQRNIYVNRPQESSQHGLEGQLFEGDYEHFELRVSGQSLENHARGNGHLSHPTEEGDVRHSPDSRGLKDTPHKKRRDAKFWTEIAHESDELVRNVELSSNVDAGAEHAAGTSTTARTKGQPESQAQTVSTSKRDRKTKARQDAPKARTTGPKPSQRGFKWPTPEE
jgi:hypothetical protein